MPNPSRHQCMVYDGAPSSHLDSIAQTLMQRLKAGYRCLYLNSAPMVAGMRWHLAKAGLELEEEVKRGALTLSSDQGHLVNGKFDVERMLATLSGALEKALADGHVGLWAAGDMTWEFGSEANLTRLLEYERALEQFMQTHTRLCGVCLYHRDALPPHAIQTALETHPAVYVSSTLSRLNPLYRSAQDAVRQAAKHVSASSGVMIVDDNEADLSRTVRLLEEAGFSGPFTTIESGQRAQERLTATGHLFQVAFVDLRMPDYDGLQLLLWIRSQRHLAHLKVLIITGDNDADDILKLREAGADGYFTKYPNPGKLAAIVSNICPGSIADPMTLSRGQN